MAPGLNHRQTGTLPKNKSKNSGSQSQRLSQEQLFLGSKNQMRNRSSATNSEAEADSIRNELVASRSSVMTSQLENGEGSSQDGLTSRINIPDRKQVVSKLTQIQNYVQQTAALMNALKVSDSPSQKNQYEKLSVMLEDLKDSESKLSKLLDKMDNAESRIGCLITDLEENQPRSNSGDSKRMQKFTRIVNENYGSILCVPNTGNGNVDADEEELARRSEESKKKLEALQKRKQDLLKLQEKAKKQLQEAQAEQSRLAARASSLNQELSANKIIDLNVQQLSQRLKAVQQMYSTRNQISDSLSTNQRTNKNEAEHPDEDQTETSDTETDFQLVADKMEELNAMKAQLGHIQKIMASINGMQNVEATSNLRESGDSLAISEQVNQNSQNSSCTEGEQPSEDGNDNIMKLEQAKSKLNHLTQLLDIVQSSQNTNGLSPSYLQLVSYLVNDEATSSTPSPSHVESVKSPQRNSEEISAETMQVMTRELEETTTAMKEERERLLAARQELQDIARRLPVNKTEGESVSPDDYLESEPPCLKPATLDSNSRDQLNGSVLTEADQSLDCNEGSLYCCRAALGRSKQRGTWNASLPGSNFSTQERRSKNESVSRGSNQSSRGCSRSLGRDSRTLEREPRWSPSPSVSYCNERSNSAVQTQNQLQMSSNLCDMMLSESLERGVRAGEISLQEMFNQHQLLTRTVAQCSQLLWLQQKQIIELRNALMLQSGGFPNFHPQQTVFGQPLVNVPTNSNSSYSGLPSRPFSNMSQVPTGLVQNFHPVNQNLKPNAGEIQSVQLSQQETHQIPENVFHQGNQSFMQYGASEVFGCDMRPGNFSRCNPSNANTNQNVNQNVNSGSNNRVPNGINCLGPEDSGALNNQVPPGNRANNYWDNFRSYSRQNLLSNTKSNEDTDTSRRCLTIASQERPPRDILVPSLSQNNQSAAGMFQQMAGNSEAASADQHLLPPSQNTRGNHHIQLTRSRSVEPQNHRNPAKNESRHQDNDARNFNVAGKNEGSGGVRARNPDSVPENIRSVRNDVNHSLNLNNSRNFVQMIRDFDNEEIPQGNNKKRLERTRCRNEGTGVLNNRGYYNTSLWENISSEVSNFIRANDVRPHFLLQLFRDLQQVTTDSLRQRTLESIEETVTANNLTERTSNMNGVNLNIIENRNNIRENRSNLNRNQVEEPNRIDELFYHLRENQNTIRQNIGLNSFVLGGNNLENPNISNIRDLGNPRNNLETEGLRDLRTYFEANLCNFGHNSTLENPNLSNIRENLTRRGPGTFDMENVQPKNVYLSIYDNAAVELRRRNQEPDFGAPYRNYEVGNAFAEPVRASEVGAAFEGAVGGRGHFEEESRPLDVRFQILDAAENFVRSRQFLANGNDSGIDINFNNEDRKRGFTEGNSSANDRTKSKKNERGDMGGEAVQILPHWERSSGRETSFESSHNLARNDINSPFIPICENFNCSCQQSDNGDLAEADQSRNEETSGAESDSGFITSQFVEPENSFASEPNQQASISNFINQNVPESERSFVESQNCENEADVVGAAAAKSEEIITFPNWASEPEGNFNHSNDSCENLTKNESSEGYYTYNACSSSESTGTKGTKHLKKEERATASEEPKKFSSKNSTNKFWGGSYSQEKFSGSDHDDYESSKVNLEAAASSLDVCQRTDSTKNCTSSSTYFEPLQLDESTEEEKGGNTSPEGESDWECGSGLDQVPIRLNKSGSSRKSEDSVNSGKVSSETL